jgi:hypothetical protein
MRILSSSTSPAEPDLIHLDVAAQEHEVPLAGDRVSIDGRRYRVLHIFPLPKRAAEFVRDRERAFALQVVPDHDPDDGAGAPALMPDVPGPLEAGAEAEPPTEPDLHDLAPD